MRNKDSLVAHASNSAKIRENNSCEGLSERLRKEAARTRSVMREAKRVGRYNYFVSHENQQKFPLANIGWCMKTVGWRLLAR